MWYQGGGAAFPAEQVLLLGLARPGAQQTGGPASSQLQDLGLPSPSGHTQVHDHIKPPVTVKQPRVLLRPGFPEPTVQPALFPAVGSAWCPLPGKDLSEQQAWAACPHHSPSLLKESRRRHVARALGR